jgi:23S rRNA (guanine745-N1)-methyltransferase
LQRSDGVWICPRGHSFDIARSGYVNLLQPQDRRSHSAGDSKAAIESRARLIASGAGRAVVDAIAARAGAIGLPSESAVVDLGCGSGELLGTIAAQQAIVGIGIDLSTPAIEAAARTFPDLLWVVANADRRLPLLDRSLDLIVSLHGRRNPVECARVLKSNGFLLAAVPGPDDLAELRELVQGERVERDRTDAVLAEHERHFTLRDRWRVRERLSLDRERLQDLLRGTYRGARHSAAARVQALPALDVTFASDVLLFAPSA